MRVYNSGLRVEGGGLRAKVEDLRGRRGLGALAQREARAKKGGCERE